MDTPEEPSSSQGPGPSLIWLMYGQVAAMLGAFSLLVFLTHFFEFGLKGVVRDAFEIWIAYVRPVVGYPAQFLVDLLPDEWRIEVPSVVKDYLAVGIICTVSFWRALMMFVPDALEMSMAPRVLAVSAGMIAIWPVIIVGVPVSQARTGGLSLDGLTAAVMFGLTWFAPLLYLALLFGANAWLA